MNFRPVLAGAVLAGAKTVTRRLVSDNPRSPWSRERAFSLIGKSVAVCPGRGQNALGRVIVTDVRIESLGYLTDDEARREGFKDAGAFEAAFMEINGRYDAGALVCRVEFKLESEETAVERLSRAWERATGHDSVLTIRRVYERTPMGAYRCVWPGCERAADDPEVLWRHVHGDHAPDSLPPTDFDVERALR